MVMGASNAASVFSFGRSSGAFCAPLAAASSQCSAAGSSGVASNSTVFSVSAGCDSQPSRHLLIAKRRLQTLQRACVHAPFKNGLEHKLSVMTSMVMIYGWWRLFLRGLNAAFCNNVSQCQLEWLDRTAALPCGSFQPSLAHSGLCVPIPCALVAPSLF